MLASVTQSPVCHLVSKRMMAMTQSNVSCSLSRYFLATHVAWKIAQCACVNHCNGAIDFSSNVFIAATVARSRPQCYFSSTAATKFPSVACNLCCNDICDQPIIILMHIYVSVASFAPKPRFRSENLWQSHQRILKIAKLKRIPIQRQRELVKGLQGIS